MRDYQDVHFRSHDGLRLHARDYPHPAPRATLLCLHGLTRNAADFEPLAAALCADYRLIVPDQRGRGRSDHDPLPANYHPGTYAQDMFTLLGALGLGPVIAIGTSMGGLMAMLMAALRPGCLRGVVLNDIGPEVEPAGLARILRNVGKGGAVDNWAAAAAAARRVNGDAFPEFGDADWMAFARRTWVEGPDGRPRPDYDPAIRLPMEAALTAAVPGNLWPAFAALLPLPALVLRGELSDILSAAVVARMRALKPDLRSVEVPRRGHAPILDEPVALAALRAFLRDLCTRG